MCGEGGGSFGVVFWGGVLVCVGRFFWGEAVKGVIGCFFCCLFAFNGSVGIIGESRSEGACVDVVC